MLLHCGDASWLPQVVPWDYDYNGDTDFDGLFISNGPGDPAVCCLMPDDET
jgi:carbamoylphosphate synthase small subunit